ncbi:MAG: hypothetical protein KDB27_20145 [Planctomycetales bacterium]|nr:hypothetical protein [Planctomycetales bacterium]
MNSPGDSLSTVHRESSSSPIWLTIYGGAAAFAAYFCMYAFRKPFSAGTYEGLTLLNTEVTLKSAFVMSQLCGYIVSKFIGVGVCSQATRKSRGITLVGLIVWAELALLLLAVLPQSLKPVAMFLNGLSLGMVWGLVVRYLEGRLISDPMLAALCCSFILASAYVKRVGLELMQHFGIAEFWMPFATGLVFFVPFLIAVWMLESLPEPTHKDQVARMTRVPMNFSAQLDFVVRFFFGLATLIAVYFVLTAYRNFRDDFSVDILKEEGIGDIGEALTNIENYVAFFVIAIVGAMFLFKGRRSGLLAMFAVMILGSVLLAIATPLYDRQVIDGRTWMFLTGLGGYLIYVPYNAALFDRIIASTGTVGTAVFAIMLADFIGYMSTIPLLLGRDLLFSGISHLQFFRIFTYVVAGVSFVLLVVSGLYFDRVASRVQPVIESTVGSEL